MIIAAKCKPDEQLLSEISEAGLEAVELYLSGEILKEVKEIVKVCQKFPLRYALHAPIQGDSIIELAELSCQLHPEVVVFHNCYWEDEWEGIFEAFQGGSAKLCIENTYSIHEPAKFMRRYKMGMCLDLEHYQMEALGVHQDTFFAAIRDADHIHMTGYRFGTTLWHTPIHHSPKHNRILLDLIKKADFQGLLVSEASPVFQTLEEFKKLKRFFDTWQRD